MCCKLRLSNKNYHSLVRWFDRTRNVCAVLLKLFMKILGPIMFASANLLAMSVMLILLFKITPPLASRSLVLYLVNLAFVVWGSINILFNYWMCMLTPAGSPTLCSDPGDVFGRTTTHDNGQKVTKAINNMQLSQGVYYKYCPTCSCIKPPRAHHCRSSRHRCDFVCTPLQNPLFCATTLMVLSAASPLAC